jgi:hypothetical protein
MQRFWHVLHLAFGRLVDEGWLYVALAALVSLLTWFYGWMWPSGASAMLALWFVTRAVRLRRILRRDYR